MTRGLISRFKNWFASLSVIQAFWFYVAFILLVLATALHNPIGGYVQTQLYLPRIEVQTSFTSDHEYFGFWYSDETVRDNGLRYLRMGKDGAALAASGIGAEVIGARMREEYKKYEQHRQADREKEERWVRDMERNGWQRGKYLNDNLTRPQRWFADPRGWNSNRPIAVSWLPDLTNLSSYLVSIAAILSLTGILGWLAGVRAQLPIRFESELKHPEPTTTKDIEPTKRTGFWSARSTKATIGAGGLCLVATITRASTPLEKMGLSDRGIATTIGETLGRLIGVGVIALIIALIIAGIMAACKKRFSTALSRAYSIGVLIASVLSLFGNFFSGSNTASNSVSPRESEAENARKMISGIEDDIQSVIKVSAGPDGLPRKNELRFESTTSATDDMHKVREMIQSFFNEMMGLQNEYLQALEDDGINTLLDANRIARDKDFKDSRLAGTHEG